MTIDVRLSALAATPLESSRAICSLADTRLAMSPAWRWVKNSTGSAITCQRKRLIMTTASLFCSLSSSDCRSIVSMARNNAVTAMPISSGTSQSVACWIRIWSTKILENPAATMLGTTSAKLTSTSRPTAGFEPRNSRNSNRRPCGLLPSFLNDPDRSRVSATPVNARSSSAMSIRRRPTAGSLI